jgi:hypothetical protein
MEWIDYDYAIVRLVPQVHIGMFLNIGVVLQARRAKFLDARFHLDGGRILAVAPSIDLELLERYVEAFARVCRGGDEGGPIGHLPISERFHWLTSPRSAIIQTSPVHPGRCHSLDEALQRIFLENVPVPVERK